MGSKTKKNIIIISVVCIAVLFGGFVFWLFSEDESSGFSTVTPKEAVELMKTKQNLLVVDIRGPQELREGWIEGSTLMPLPDILNGKASLPKDRPILLVCAVGGRSLGLGKAMISYGWTEVYNLQSGIAEWKRQGFPVRYR